MQIRNFALARRSATEVLSHETEREGLVGDMRYVVVLTDDAAGKPIDDLVTFVHRDTGAVSREVYFDVADEISSMEPIRDDA